MSEKSEELTRKNEGMKPNLTASAKSGAEARTPVSLEETRQLPTMRYLEIPQVAADTARPLPRPSEVDTKKDPDRKKLPTKFTKLDAENARMLQERCRQLCLSLFFREHAPVRSLGFTSSIVGEGKSFLALVTSQVLATDSSQPVTLVECNWEHPTLHEYFGVPSAPGLAEWLRGTCQEKDIRYQVDDNLTFIPAGNGTQDIVKLLQQVQQQSLMNLFLSQNELFIAELPPVLTCGYGSLAARLFESIVIVIRAQVIPDNMVAETCAQLQDMPIHGIILNQMESHIPRWIRQLL